MLKIILTMWKYSKLANNIVLKRKIHTNLNRASSFDFSEEVKHGLEAGAPVVALESTIITHGMPFPENMNCALEVENIVRQQGAIPATIAILGGRITVGLNYQQISYLADTKSNHSIKTSRRDFPYVKSKQMNGGTTVSGTIIVAEKAGIPIFVTGGIGGVHREGEKTLDISADLTELGRSSIAVVSAGVKSILDIPRTLEFLETEGVFVATFGDSTNFPAFYSRTSGCHAPYNVSSAKEAAEIIDSSFKLKLKSGMLFAVPVPETDALDEQLLQEAIDQALKDAQRQGVTGKNITPFLLSAVAKITKGRSLQTNIALIKNNAKVGAQIAVELSKTRSGNKIGSRTEGTSESLSESASPLVIGGSVFDCCASIQDSHLKLDGSLHYTKFSSSAGGVGRNICEALEKLGAKPVLLSVVGNDNQGAHLRSLLSPSSAKAVKIIPGSSTAQCTVVLDSNGECKLLLGEMEINKQITADLIKTQRELLIQSPLIVTDGNLPVETLSCVLEIAKQYGKPIFYEPTDVPVAANPFLTKHSDGLKYISPNLNELRFIVNSLGLSIQKEPHSTIWEACELGKIVANYVDTIFITLGVMGMIIIRKASATDPLFLNNVNKNGDIQIRHYPITEITNLVNVSGAGDCLASGLIFAMLAGCPENVCVSVGFAAAQMALQSPSAVPKVLFDKNHESWQQEASCIQL